MFGPFFFFGSGKLSGTNEQKSAVHFAGCVVRVMPQRAFPFFGSFYSFYPQKQRPWPKWLQKNV